MKLTDRTLSALQPPEKGQSRIRDDLLSGFGVTVGKKTKTFFVMYGKERRIKTLGQYPHTSLKDARDEARRILSTQTHQHRIDRLWSLRDAFLDDCRTRLRPESVRSYDAVLKNAPDLPLTKVSKTTVTVETPHQIKAYKALFNWAIQQEIVSKNPFLHLTARFGKRDRVLSDDELRALWQYEQPVYSQIVKLLILTGQRVGQIGQFDPAWVKNNVITFPPEVMKMGRAHQIPVTPLLKQYLPRIPHNWKGWSAGKLRMDKHTKVTDYTLHDIRRTFATIHAQLGTPIHVIEALLNHTSGTISGVAAIYIRHKFLHEMESAQLTYEAHLTTLVTPRA